MNYPLVTISIPIYKCEDFLEQCLNSVLSQTYKNIEVTLINDQTPDNSVEIAEKFIAENNLKESWKIYHLEENSGLSVVRNKGIDTANGKYIFFLDSDDTITPDCIEKLVNVAEKNYYQMVVGNTVMINISNSEKSDFYRVNTTNKRIIGNKEVMKSFVNGEYPTSSWNKLIRVDFLKDNQLYFTAGLFAQDELQSFQTALVLNSVGFLHPKDITLYYYLHGNSVIHNRGKRHFDNWCTIGSYIDKALKSEEDKERKKLILKYLTNFKTVTLVMNWKAKQDEKLWKDQYAHYRTLSSLSIWDYFSSDFSSDIKKKDFWMSFPTSLAMKIFKKRYHG